MLVVANDAFDCAKFVTAESEVASQTDRFEPELRGIVVAVHVYMRGFIWLVAVEIEPIRPTS